MHAAGTPPWVGPLDVVVVAGDDAGDPGLAESVDAAVRRGAEVVVAAPDEGPLRAVTAGRAVLLPPRVQVPTRYALARHVAVFYAVLAVMRDVLRRDAAEVDLARLADAVDQEALRDHPSNEVFHNPAKSLAVRMQSRRVILAGDRPATVALARHASESLLQSAGVVASAASLSDVLVARDRLLGRSTVRVNATIRSSTTRSSTVPRRCRRRASSCSARTPIGSRRNVVSLRYPTPTWYRR